MSPRKSQDEMIAELERKLAEARAKAGEKRVAQITRLQEKRATLVEREKKIAADILKVDQEISELVTEGSQAGAEEIEEVLDKILDPAEADEV